MKQRKQDLLRCLTWLRNGICFCFTWLALLALILCRIRQTPYMSVDLLRRHRAFLPVVLPVSLPENAVLPPADRFLLPVCAL